MKLILIDVRSSGSIRKWVPGFKDATELDNEEIVNISKSTGAPESNQRQDCDDNDVNVICQDS